MSKKLMLLLFWTSAVFILMSLILLLVFKAINFTNVYAAYVVAICAVLGGTGIIVTSLVLFWKTELEFMWSEKLLFHLPELIGVGLLAIVFGIILFWGKMIK